MAATSRKQYVNCKTDSRSLRIRDNASSRDLKSIKHKTIAMQKTTKQQRQAIYRLTGYNKQYKAELVYQVTQDRQKISTHDLNFNQANTIIVALGGQAYHRDVFWAFFDPHSKQHKYILSLVQQAGHKKTSVNYGYVADLDWLDKFLHRDSPVKKPLKSMTPDETSKIIFALEEIVKWKNGQKS